MYLISWVEEEAKLEASLGGRVTIEEMNVVLDEIREMVTDHSEAPYLVVIDYSRAKLFDHQTEIVLDDIKDICLKNGAEKIVNIIREIDDIETMTTARFQSVMEGTEDFVTDPSVINWTPSSAIANEKRLAA